MSHGVGPHWSGGCGRRGHRHRLAIPIFPRVFLACKLLFFALLSLAFMLASWLEILLLALLCGLFLPVSELSLPCALLFLMRMLLGGALLWATQTPLIYLAIRSRGFVAPITAITAVSLVNVVLSGSALAGFYPWAAAYLLTLGRMPWQGCPASVSLSVIAGVCLLGIGASLACCSRTS